MRTPVIHRFARLAAVAAAVAGAPACADPEDDLAPTARELLAASGADGVHFDLDPGRSTMLLAWTFTAFGEQRDLWVPITLDFGRASALADDDRLEVDLSAMLLDIPLLPGEGDRVAVSLAALHVGLAAPLDCAAAWDELDEQVRCQGSPTLVIDWALRVDDLLIELPPPPLDPSGVTVEVAHTGDELRFDAFGAITGAAWSVPGFAARGTLMFGLEGRVLAAPAAP